MNDGKFRKGQKAWNAGLKKVQDLTEIRACKKCLKKKIVTEFVKGAGNLYRYTCKDCVNAALRTGKPNLGRFKKGSHPGREFQKGQKCWYKEKGLPAPRKGKRKSKSKHSMTAKEWITTVKTRDGFKCNKCGSKNRIAAHHIEAWKDNESLRFDVDNGITLCCSCHAKEEGFQKGQVPWNKK